MDDLRPHIAGLAAALGELAVAYTPRRRPTLLLHGDWRLVEPGSREHAEISALAERIRAAQMAAILPSLSWLSGPELEEVMVEMAMRASLGLDPDVDPSQRAADAFFDPTFVPDPADEADVAALPIAAVIDPGPTCPVCLEDMRVGDAHHVLPCRHVMHVACSTEWFRSGTRCPACNVSPFGLKGPSDRL